MKNSKTLIFMLAFLISSLGFCAGSKERKRRKRTSREKDSTEAGLLLVLDSLNQESRGESCSEVKKTIAAMLLRKKESPVLMPSEDSRRSVKVKFVDETVPCISDFRLDKDETYPSLRRKLINHPDLASYVARDVAKGPSKLVPAVEEFFKEHSKRPFYNLFILGADFKPLSDEKVKELKNSSEIYIFSRGLNLEEADFSGKILRGSDLRWANLRNTIFWYTDCSGSDFEGADGEGGDFRRTIFDRCNMKYMNLKGAMFNGSTTYDSDFTGANLYNTTLYLEDFDPEKNPEKNVTLSQLAFVDAIIDSDDEGSSDSE